MSTRKQDTSPTFDEENLLQSAGFVLTAGVDEVGRGCLAGPVVASAVILPVGLKAAWLREVRDSKKLSAKQRESLFVCINEAALSVGTGIVSHEVIDSIGIARATKQSMKEAVMQLSPAADSLLVDYIKLSDLALPQKSITHGDALCYSIACASIIAKVSRDRMMQALDAQYPGYGLSRNKGYGTREHLRCIEGKGLSPIHRRSFCHFQRKLAL